MVLEGLTLAIAIFVMRIINYAVGTLRLVVITRNMRALAASFAFIEAFIFAVVIANIVQNLGDTLNLFAYCMGASVGSYLGMIMEGRFITSYRVVNIITHTNGHEMAVLLRDAGFGVTESHGEGRDGHVVILRSVVMNTDVNRLITTIKDFEEETFISIEEARSVRHGWIRSLRGLPQ